jgi:hypothetical protein
MDRLRGRLVAIAAPTLAVLVAVVALGALRACWANEHTHAGVAAEDCPMHHHSAGHSQATHGGHHGHGTGAVPVDDGQRLACGCGSDPASPYVGPAGMLPPRVVVSHLEAPVLVSRPAATSPDDLHLPPLAPPPRSTFSARS